MHCASGVRRRGSHTRSRQRRRHRTSVVYTLHRGVQTNEPRSSAVVVPPLPHVPLHVSVDALTVHTIRPPLPTVHRPVVPPVRPLSRKAAVGKLAFVDVARLDEGKLATAVHLIFDPVTCVRERRARIYTTAMAKHHWVAGRCCARRRTGGYRLRWCCPSLSWRRGRSRADAFSWWRGSAASVGGPCGRIATYSALVPGAFCLVHVAALLVYEERLLYLHFFLLGWHPTESEWPIQALQQKQVDTVARALTGKAERERERQPTTKRRLQWRRHRM
ncbi:hypothetical protein, conserved [Leishmania tarentolae]|uniref:Uncharacterized protein n=1 Tax=Leishmania tarentolae TaxID=5689 RepID=A0A640KAK4_LEITA|nr:hypothetical protein, conserved [Leishmania tarentolae]